MKKGRITIKDLAKQLGMSTSTVSRALTDHSDVSSNTRKKVKELAAKLDYQPDPIAIGLRRNKTNVVGIIVPQIVNRFFSKCISGFQEVARANGYKVMITQSDESLEMEKENLVTMINSRVDGLVVALSRQTSDLSHFEKIFDADIPIVFFDRVDESLNTSRVTIDDYEASYNAVKHLIEQGCKKIAHVSGPINLEISKKRLAGYKDALNDHKLVFDENHLVFSENQTDQVKNITDYYLGLKNRPDGIFAINDAFAIEMVYNLKREKIKIPEDIAIVGFNNEIVSEFVDPPLTSVDSPASQLGEEAARLLLTHIDYELEPTVKVLKSKLVIRKSSLKKGT